MECTQAYTLWCNYKAKKRLITEKKIKGRCTLRDRHWKFLERTWYSQFRGMHQDFSPRNLAVFLKYYPGYKDENLIRIIKSGQYEV